MCFCVCRPPPRREQSVCECRPPSAPEEMCRIGVRFCVMRKTGKWVVFCMFGGTKDKINMFWVVVFFVSLPATPQITGMCFSPPLCAGKRARTKEMCWVCGSKQQFMFWFGSSTTKNKFWGFRWLPTQEYDCCLLLTKSMAKRTCYVFCWRIRFVYIRISVN